MATANIKISQLPNIGGNLNGNTLLPVVSTNGTFLTDKVTVGTLANYILDEAGNLLTNAFVSTVAYSVANAAQPNITSVGTLAINNLHISGGTNGYVLQTNGNGNLSWTAMAGSGNGNPGGANTQVQFNDAGSFGGSTGLTYDKTTFTLGTVSLQASNITIYDDIFTANINATGNINAENVSINTLFTTTVTSTGNISAPFFVGNGSALTGITASASGAGPNRAIQYNINGIFAGDTNLTFNPANSTLSTVDIVASSITTSGINATNNVTANIVTANFLLGDGSNITNISNANYANSANIANTAGVANSVAVANVVGLGNIATLSLDGNSGNVLYGNGVFSTLPIFGNANYANFAGEAYSVDGANIVGVVANANYSMHVNVNPTTNNFSYHVVLIANPGSDSLQVDGDDNLQYNPDDGTLTTIRLDTEYLNVTYEVLSNLIPFSDITYSLGNSTNRWKDIYLANSTIYLGNATLSANGNSVVVSNLSVTDGNIGTIGNIAGLNLDGNSSNILYGNGVFAPGGGGGANLGNLQITGTTIGIANGATETSIVTGANNASLTVDTDNGVPVINLQVQSTDSQYYEESFDYTSGTWVVNGLEGQLTISGYSPSFETFLNNLGQYQSFTITINGSETTATNGYSYGGGNATFYTLLPPGVDPTTVNNIEFNLVFSNKLLMDPDDGTMGVYVGQFTFEIESQRDVRISAGDDFSIRANDSFQMRANSDFEITTNYNNTQQNWAFLATGNLDIPGNINFTGDPSAAPKLNNFFGVTSAVNFEITTNTSVANLGWVFDNTGNLVLAGGNSVIQSVANSSLDPINPNVSTIVLTPDANYSSQALVLDPTAPGHIHLRAFASSNIDEPSANIFLGGENTAFEITQGANNVAKIHSGGNTWTFTNAGDLQLAAGNSVISSLPNNAGDSSGLSTLNLYPDSSTGDDRYLIIDPTGPNHLHLRAGGVQDASNVLLYLGGEQTYVQVDDGYHRVSINSYDVGNTTSYNWKFNYDGNLVLPGNTFAINFANGTQASAPLVDITDTNGLTTVYYPTFVENRTDGQIVRADVDLSYRTDTNTLTVGNITGNTNGYTLGYLNIPQVSASNTTLQLSDAGKHYYSTTVGNLTLTVPNNATTSFATGTAISIVVQAAGNVLVNAASGVTLYMAGSSTAGNRIVGSYGMATLMKVASDTWFINGTGVY